MVAVRFFAAAEDAVGAASATSDAATLGALRAEFVAAHPALGAILDRCALLVDGSRVGDDFALAGAETVDVLPPFAGG